MAVASSIPPAGRWVNTHGIGAYYVLTQGRRSVKLGVIWEGMGGSWWSGIKGTTNREHPSEFEARQHVERETRAVAKAFVEGPE